jgi:uncharacterized 2Fe-2S/4Fe-4S cluster protein (DUF4445 family)
VKIRPDGLIDTEVIGDGSPDGICGSGLVDLLSELIRTGQMNPLGRFENGERIAISSQGDNEIYLTESDVNELAQAKGANVAGLRVVFNEYGIGFDDLDVFYLAGGFGRHLSVESSKRIGLIPEIHQSKIRQVGNAAIEGACIALLSRAKRAELERLVRSIVHCRLETDPNFFDYFVEGCQFKPLHSHEPAETKP